MRDALAAYMTNPTRALLSATLFLFACGGEYLDGDGEDLGPYAEQMPWSEFMATSSMDTVAGVEASGVCTTAALRGLADQIVAQMNCIHPGLMDRIDGDGVSLGNATLPYLQRPASQVLKSATAGHGLIPLNSALRTLPQQWVLRQWALQHRCGIQRAAPPSLSNHEDGLALDTSAYGSWRGTLERHPFRWFGGGDVVHFDYVGAGATAAHGVLAFQRLWNHNHPHDQIAADGAYGPATEDRVKRSPRRGFPGAQGCR